MALTTRVCDLEAELERLRREHRRVEADCSKLQAAAEQEREAIAKDAELKLYRTLEAERAKWEAREQRAVDQLELVRCELLFVDKHGFYRSPHTYR